MKDHSRTNSFRSRISSRNLRRFPNDIYLQYLYQAEGAVLPIGIQRNTTPYIRTVPSSAKDNITLLYENPEICLLEYRDGPPEDQWLNE